MSHLQLLFEVERCLKEARVNLRNQQVFASSLSEYEQDLCRVLLSTSLRTFASLEDQRDALLEAVGEWWPLVRELGLDE